MKKRDLWTGMALVLSALLCALSAIFCWDTPLDSLLCGFSGALAVPGVMQIWKYHKWTQPQNRAAYQEKLEMEQIDLRDERKEMLRNKSGRYAYVLGMAFCCLAIFALSILDYLEILNARLLITFLGAYVLFQYLAGIWIYRRLAKKY